MNLVFDIGGLSTKYLLFTSDKTTVICEGQVEYQSLIDNDQIITIVNKVYQKLQISYQIENIAFSSLGVINPLTGEISGLGAIKNYHLVNWKDIFKDKVNVYIENDANCAARYELTINQNITNALMFVIGTGLGGAVIINRQIYHGSHFMAGEFGCGLEEQKGTIYKNISSCSSTYSAIIRYYEKTGIKKTGRELFALYDKDENARTSIDAMVSTLAKGIINFALVIDPDTILIGGGISENTFFLRLLSKEIEKLTKSLGISQTFVLQACQKNNKANLYGALTLIP
ncbi:ROK family protein [Spiroplasma chrysopicola]|uniref:Putative ROK family sugar kinase n=1 Tax=Spiroplasma chrysopicola DF-1 TaxID=1276227 RepID=R4UBU0_9MOLU|nr:ROK family protein [Spiroplasma chrysopicola]AGM25389.1 putative ROK family sugar kinase [Spiroplasma chrysopicola DF-1]